MSLRLFAALELPAPLRARLAAYAAAAAAADPALRTVDEQALHLTLAFLGERDEREASAVGAALMAIPSAAAPALELERPLWLSPRRPHVLAIAVGDRDGTLAALQADVVEALAAATAWRPEARPFLAHVTVARVRRGERPRQRALSAPPRSAFAPSALVLLRSHLGRTPRYEALARRSLLA